MNPQLAESRPDDVFSNLLKLIFSPVSMIRLLVKKVKSVSPALLTGYFSSAS